MTASTARANCERLLASPNTIRGGGPTSNKTRNKNLWNQNQARSEAHAQPLGLGSPRGGLPSRLPPSSAGLLQPEPVLVALVLLLLLHGSEKRPPHTPGAELRPLTRRASASSSSALTPRRCSWDAAHGPTEPPRPVSPSGFLLPRPGWLAGRCANLDGQAHCPRPYPEPRCS